MALIKCKECGAEVSSKAKACPKCGATMPKRTSFGTWIVLGLIVLIVGVVYLGPSETTAPPRPETQRQPSPSEQMRANIDVEYSFRVGPASAMLVSGSITNNNDFAIGDILFRCTTYGETNTALDRKSYTFRRVLAPGESITMAELNLGRVDRETSRASCRVVDADF